MAIKPLSTPDWSAIFVSLDIYDPLLNAIGDSISRTAMRHLPPPASEAQRVGGQVHAVVSP